MHRVVGWPKAPALVTVWLGQNCPVAFVAEALPVVSGFKLTGRFAWKPESGGRQLRLVVTTTPSVVQAFPLSSPGEPFTSIQVASHVPEMQRGHGSVLLPVM